MPAPGYRKGISDGKEPARNLVRAHLTDATYTALVTDADARCVAVSKILRELATAHYDRRRPELPRAAAQHAALIRELGRIGNNLNQIARLGNTDPRLVPIKELQTVLLQLARALERV